ncbi:MAG: PilT/PilU family type 4a pilus ATPase [Phycisphaerales bacterium]|nr:PilT/PilU family type 4a pilus ATPase [Phycisphaerales bacterium]
MLDVEVSSLGPGVIERALGCLRNGHHAETDVPYATLSSLLERAVEAQASDVHLVPGYPATFRIHGELAPVDGEALAPGDVRRMVEAILPERVRGRLETERNFDCSVAVSSGGQSHRFRANVYLAQGNWCACLRHVPTEIPTLEWLGFPDALAARLASHSNGLVIVTGVTGSGKTSTLAALVSLLRRDASLRILTIEEPIEYLHPVQGGSMVTQREVGRDVDSFADGLKYGLRQDPDVILVGEIRDRETAQMALSAAETGHLILTTLHTRDAKGALTRLVDLFPQDQQDDVRSQLALSLRSIVCQHLLPSAQPGQRRALALEVLHNNLAVQVAIRTGKIETIESAIQTGKREGMFLLDEDLQRLVSAGQVTLETARRYASDPAAIKATKPAW